MLAALLAVALAACGGVRVPVKDSRGSVPIAETCDRDRAGSGRVVVCRGDTLIGLAKRNNVTVANLMRVNGLRNDRIMAGSVLILPDEYVYVVQPGDTLLDVSRTTGVPVSRLIAANELTDPNRLLPMTELAVPRSATQVAAAPRATTPQTLPETLSQQRDATGPPLQTPSVTIGRPTRTAPSPTEPQSVPAAEPGQATDAPNQPAPEITAPTQPLPETDMEPAQPPPKANVAPTPRQRPAEPAARPASAAPAEAEPRTATPSAPAGSSFMLPVEGKILSDFGPKSGGLHNDGINISAPRGTAIKATADGSVAYAGDGLPGFGNLILIKHADGWTSAYAHADSMTVKRGDTVQQGQTIGTVGDTGSVSQPQLHFELRQHDRAVDPTGMVR